MTDAEIFITLAMVWIGTAATRFAPFLLFGTRTPAFVSYIGRHLPKAAIALLVVYCFKDVSPFEGSRGVPELAAASVTAALQFAFRRELLSIAAGTAVYMILIRA